MFFERVAYRKTGHKDFFLHITFCETIDGLIRVKELISYVYLSRHAQTVSPTTFHIFMLSVLTI
jgi:hypothetical protein